MIAVPAFLLFSSATLLAALGGALLLGLFAGSLHTMVAVLAVELFPPQTRYAGSGISYGFGTGLIGGTTPLVATWLVAITGSALAPGWYLLGVFAVAIIITLPLLRETFTVDIDAVESEGGAPTEVSADAMPAAK